MSNFGQPLNWARRLAIAILAGVLAGGAAALFLNALDSVTALREIQPLWLWSLPFIGFFVGYLYHRYGRDISAGHNLILDEIHDPRKRLPFMMAPAILVATLLSHLAGASVGREGTSIQMGGALADQLSRLFKLGAGERRLLLVSGMAAGFGAAIGTPWAGAIFGMEVLRVGRLRVVAPVECLLASFAGFWTTQIFRHHFEFPETALPALSLQTLLYVALIGLLFGLVARFFVLVTHTIEKLQQKFVSYPPLRPFVGGLVLVATFTVLGSMRYSGLGWSVIVEAFTRPLNFADPVLKLWVTAVSVGSGFKGGEFTPLVFMGTTLGSALSEWLPLPVPFLAGLGYAAVFAGAANTPLACSVMAAELFGWPILPYALLACLLSFCVSAKRGIYKAQRLEGENLFKWRR